jgi:GT2 family glycosyltransferase/nucleoside-diphosphate-sugar epimerase
MRLFSWLKSRLSPAETLKANRGKKAMLAGAAHGNPQRPIAVLHSLQLSRAGDKRDRSHDEAVKSLFRPRAVPPIRTATPRSLEHFDLFPDPMNEPKSTGDIVSVVIVNFNGGDLLMDCVRSVLASTARIEVLVSDNGSTDHSLTKLRQYIRDDPRVRIVENGINLGFARANNAVVAMARGKYVLFLNPDCIIQPDALERMRAIMDTHPDAGMAGCLIRNFDGKEQPGCRRYVPTPWRAFVRVFKLSRIFRNHPRFSSFILTGQPLPEIPTPVEAISGAFMFVRRSAMETAGLMDDGYFLHCEDLDWCMRFRQAGLTVLFVPNVEILHAKGVGSAGRPIRVEWHKHLGMIRFYRKFFRNRYPSLLMIVVIGAILARFAAIAAVLAVRNLHASALADFPSPNSSGLYPAVGRAVPVLPEVIVTGATSQIGHFLLPWLQAAGYRVHAISRRAAVRGGYSDQSLVWHEIDIEREASSLKKLRRATALIHLAPLGTIPPLLDVMAQMGVKRIIAFGSTSRYSKLASANSMEQRLAQTLIESEKLLEEKCSAAGMAWTLFRPTLIYGCGMDRNVTTIANFINVFGFFPIVGEGKGLRQPVHADDLAAACLGVLHLPTTWNRAYNLSGGETLTYRQMVERIFEELGKKPRIVKVPLAAYAVLLRVMSLWPSYRHLNIEMVNRMNMDLNYDHADAKRDFGYAPRRLEFSPRLRTFDIGRKIHSEATK